MNNYFQTWEALAGSYQAKKNKSSFDKLLRSVDPVNDDVTIRFREGQHTHIEAVYRSLGETNSNWFVKEDNHFRLHTDHNSTPEQLYTALHQLSKYLHDVRFLVIEDEPN